MEFMGKEKPGRNTNGLIYLLKEIGEKPARRLRTAPKSTRRLVISPRKKHLPHGSKVLFTRGRNYRKWITMWRALPSPWLSVMTSGSSWRAR